MKIIFSSILFLISNFCVSQSKQVTIIGNIPQLYGGDYASFCKPIGEFTTTTSYINSKDTAVIKNDRFIKKIDISVPGIIYVFEKPFNGTISTRFFAEPGDTVLIERKNKEFFFKGKNAVLNKMYSDIKLGPVAFSDEVYDIFKNNSTSEEIIKNLNKKEKDYLKIYSDFFQNKQISKSCLEYTKKIMEISIDGLALNIAMDEEYRKNENMLLPIEEANKIVDYINLKYIPFDKANLRIPFFLGQIRKTGMYLENQSLKNNKKIERFWNQYDNIFKHKTPNPNIGVLDYIEIDDYKEAYIGTILLDLIKNYDNEKTIKYKDLIVVYKVFAEKFPNSPYIIPLSECMMDKALNNLSTTNGIKLESKTILGSLVVYEVTFESKNVSPFAQTSQSLVDAIAEKFPNQDLLVDLWATWCGPCVKQFQYNDDLHSFLDRMNVKTLYVSADKEEDILKWEKYIQDYNLKGYHFLANNTYQEKFLNPLSEFIPRYFIYNSKTKKLQLLEGFPSEKENFYAKIEKALLN
jgi:thiol-disulfide isomerase/thioredoxin